jgi:PAS domain S-box-containing protein
MTEGLKSLLAELRDPRLAPHAAGALPAWLWRADGTAILWANAAGAAIFGAQHAGAIRDRAFDPHVVPASQIARLGSSLRHDGGARLERLRGFGTGMGRPLLCTCTRIVERSAILVTAAEPAGPALSNAERVRRLFEGLDESFAVFGLDGSLLFASPSASSVLGARASFEQLGIGGLLDAARQSGLADGIAATGPVAIERIGSGADAILVATLEEHAAGTSKPSVAASAAAEQVTPQPLPPAPEPVQAQPSPEAMASKSVTRGDPANAPESPDRRYPLRFIWEMDADSRFRLTGNEFTAVIGPEIAVALGRPWNEIAAQLGLDPAGDVAAAIASRNTWSGITVNWPVEGSDRRLPVELSGLPIYDRDRAFRGYRGFGVCRDVPLVEVILAQRTARDRSAPAPQIEKPDTPLSRPVLTVVPSAENVVPFPGQSSENKVATLTPVERNAFSELATRLTERLKGADELATSGKKSDTRDDLIAQIPASDPPAARETDAPVFAPREERPRSLDRTSLEIDRPMLDRLPVGILVYRHDQFIYANPAFLEWAGHPTLNDFAEAGGLDTLFVEPPKDPTNEKVEGERLRLATPRDGSRPLEARLLSIPWDGGTAMALVFTAIERPPGVETPQESAPASAPAIAKPTDTTFDLDPVFDLLSDAVVLVSPDGTIERSNRSADEIFGYELLSLSGRALTDILSPDGARSASADLAMLTANSAASLSGEREIVGRREKGGLVSLVMRMSRLKSGQICVIFRNLSQWRTSETDLIEAKRKAEDSSAAKSEFIARISHEIRTPLNAIIGFSEVMMRERFGPIANERYRDYLRDIHSSGEHLVELLGDMIDLTRIEAGKFDLNISRVGLNDLIQQTVSMLQPQASRARVVVRLSLAPNLPAIQADPRSVRQIFLNLLTNAIKFTGAGGQIIVSTGPSEKGGVALRIRDTGKGMSPKDLAVALEPFRQVGDADRVEPRGAGLGLPLAKALAEANHAVFSISSAVDSGTLVEIEFPAARMVAE